MDHLQSRVLQAERRLIVDVLSRIKERELASVDWLKTHAPDLLDERWPPSCGPGERIYWHYGYAMALRDVMRMFAN
jgi:hypothetical protein